MVLDQVDGVALDWGDQVVGVVLDSVDQVVGEVLDRVDQVVGIAGGCVGLEGGGGAFSASSPRFSKGRSSWTALSVLLAAATTRRARRLAREGECLGLGPGRG